MAIWWFEELGKYTFVHDLWLPRQVINLTIFIYWSCCLQGTQNWNDKRRHITYSRSILKYGFKISTTGKSEIVQLININLSAIENPPWREVTRTWAGIDWYHRHYPWESRDGSTALQLKTNATVGSGALVKLRLYRTGEFLRTFTIMVREISNNEIA